MSQWGFVRIVGCYYGALFDFKCDKFAAHAPAAPLRIDIAYELG